ncbi:MAG: bifunctional phosphopantothenoylcysteine decarboxylase/phosphopantothenate--cysteine ligase CoaBC [Candidatus Heimdallarchaeota archaeon]|nr:bifunctional phosphopantothenoylcysteine decarboxylase/phosphopantothenate--cysteine ligase CoaBC [Candidatus Heimdallarchaeota archaeon]
MRGTKSKLLDGKRIVIGLTGSVAVVEIVNLARTLMRHGAEIFIAMTKAATKLIQPDLLEWAVGNPVITKLTGQIEHVHLCGQHPDKADLLLIAPSTANTIGKIANGIDDTVVTTFATTALGTGIPIAIVPAMHATMYDNPIVVENIAKLKKIGITFIGPRKEEGKAKIATIDDIVESVIGIITTNDFKGKKIVITAGPTRAWLDDVRYITNPSSGKMGISLALEAISRGAEVTLLLGSTNEKVPNLGVNVIHFETTQDLLQKVDALSSVDIFISAAAIGDYELDKIPGKIPSKKDSLVLTLRPSPKVIDHVRQKFPKAKIIGFKAEVKLSKEELIAKAQTSLKEHNIEMVIANLVDKQNQGFASETNSVIVITKDNKINEISLLTKRELSKELFNLIKQIK